MNKNERRMGRNRRVFVVLMGMSMILLLLIMRLAWLQLMPAAPASTRSLNWKREAVAQRERGLVLDSGRGDFYDRHGLAITGETYKALAVFPLQASSREMDSTDFAKLARELGVEKEMLEKWVRALKEPAFWQAKGEMVPQKLSERQLKIMSGLHLNGIRVLPYRNRYPSSFDEKHIIGYMSQHPELLRSKFHHELSSGKMLVTDMIGGSGLEQSLDRLLRGTGATSVSYFTDGADKPLKGLNMRLTSPSNPYYPLRIMTTLDLSIQNEVEDYMDLKGLKEGAIVVLDARSGDIISMVSRPQLAAHTRGSGGTDLADHAIRSAIPGSVFKLVTEAAALEAKATDEREIFTCNGDYGHYGLHCWKDGGHGRISLREALAQSCNVAFATLAERLTAEQFTITADQLGIGRRIGWSSEESIAPLGQPLRLFKAEEAGRLFSVLPKHRDGGLLAQTGIGQRDVRISPLQAANLVLTILHEGQVIEPRLVSEIRFANGQRMIALQRQYATSRYGRVSRATLQTLLRGMEAVVTDGTGRPIREGVWTVAGKSGTAQTLRDGLERNNQWFTGYGPIQSPRYVVAVLAENRATNSSNQATAVFRGVMDILAKHTDGAVLKG
ncbi:penicillin-binding protein [Paenibacillus baekrokdamisoli]|uniref:Penicillin-binding protein n=1 Tax=Paenibacillus baekrokdamisoli TaxID=1712516 RepID=A0A3G9JE11_9BACL|nr:penicillin-binding protein 2 [Paenibacillus baekrokdamisoli]MBB3071017.1 cell division protein FtsI/penicillin-binding protein 2 [Paenibacillus baekrokdamisoli]BBH21434.1 penicillin-binding protein [Paenibacillus baekrokdamisoli]